MNNLRNDLIRQVVEELEGITLIIVTQINHGDMLQQLLPESTFVNGKEQLETRKQIIKDIKNRKIKNIIATTIYDEGVDLPSIDNLIIACGGKSEIKTIQRVGRGLRKEGK